MRSARLSHGIAVAEGRTPCSAGRASRDYHTASRSLRANSGVSAYARFAGQTVGVSRTADHVWLVTFMDYDSGYFDDETCRLEPIADAFGQ